MSPDIKNLKKLKWLSISSTKVERLPEEICDLKDLEALFIGYTKIRILPARFEELKKLKKLGLEELEIGVTIENDIRNTFPDAEIEF